MEKFEDWLGKALPRGVPRRGDSPPAAEWMDHAELARGGWEFRNAKGEVAGLFIGRWGGAEYGAMDDRHVLTVAGSRAGKGASLIIPNLLQYEGSVVAIDPTGELARITAEHRAKEKEEGGLGQNVLVLDPFGTSRQKNGEPHPLAGALNPLDAIDLSKPEALDDAMAITEAMIQVPEHGEKHWAESAQAVVQALVLFVKLLEDEEERNLCTVHDLLMLGHRSVTAHAALTEQRSLVKALFDMVDMAAEKMLAGGERVLERYPDAAMVLEGVGKTYGEMEGRERESVLSAARTQTRFLRSPALRGVLGKSAIRLQQIKRERTTVYLCLPVRHMGSHAKWLRIMVTLFLQSFEDEFKPDIPVLVVLDEFNALGHMRSIEIAAGQLAGFGVKLWTVLQDIGQIEGLYGEGWETFIGNAGVLTFFGNTDQKTLEYIEKKLGRRTFVTERPNESTPGARYSGAPLMTRELRHEGLLAPHEIAEILGRGKGCVLVLAAEKKPVILQRALYHDPKDRFYKLAHGG